MTLIMLMEHNLILCAMCQKKKVIVEPCYSRKNMSQPTILLIVGTGTFMLSKAALDEANTELPWGKRYVFCVRNQSVRGLWSQKSVNPDPAAVNCMQYHDLLNDCTFHKIKSIWHWITLKGGGNFSNSCILGVQWIATKRCQHALPSIADPHNSFIHQHTICLTSNFINK